MNFPLQSTLRLFSETNGAISLAEGCAIHHLASLAPDGCAVELGAHCGKAAVMAASAFATDRQFHLVDPCFDVTNREAWAHSCQGVPENAWGYAHDPGFNGSVVNRIFMASRGKVDPVLMGDYSLHAVPQIEGPISYCLIDSNEHTYELCRDECALLKDKMAIGGLLVFHDFMSQFLGVEQAYREMLQGGMYHEVGIDWQTIIQFVKDSGFKEEENVSWHHREMEFPCFLGALIRVK
jgi:hypothetical protein